METSRDLELSALALGALDPCRAAALRGRLAADPPLQSRYEALAAAIAARLSQATLPRWRVSSLSLRDQPVAVSPAPMLEALSPRELLEVYLPTRPDADQVAVVVLSRVEGEAWQVVFPQSADDWVTLSELEETPEGRRLMVSAGAGSGRQRWAALFPPRELEIDWSLPEDQRWEGLRAALLRGQLAPVTWQAEVRPEPPGDR